MKTVAILSLTCDDLYTTVEEVYWRPGARVMHFSKAVVNDTKGEKLFRHSTNGLVWELMHITSMIYFTGRDDLTVLVNPTDGPVMIEVAFDRPQSRALASCPLADFETIHDVVKWTRMVGQVLARTGGEQT